MAMRITQAVLVATLIASSGVPALADKPDHGRHVSRQTQQEQELNTAGKRKGNKSKTVKKTIANGNAIAIPAPGSVDDFGPAAPYPSTLAVTGFKKAKITDLNLTLRGLSHTASQDVDVLLVAPDGRNVVVMGDVGESLGSGAVTNLILTLDDEATNALPTDDPLTSGTFRPLDNFGLVDFEDPSPGVIVDFPAPAPIPSGDIALSTFDGLNPNGEWQLFILDDASLDIGSLANGWTLEITAKSKVKTKNKRKH
jgi:subtilisin-like proprotein convertase family protein